MKKKKAQKLDLKYDLRAKDVAWILDCSPDDVIMWARKGLLKGIKRGRFWRFQRSDVNLYKRKSQRGG